MKLSYRHSMSGILWLWSTRIIPMPPTAVATTTTINGGLQTPVTSIPMNVYCLSIYYKFDRAPENLCALSKKQAFGRLGRRSGLSIPPRQGPPLSERLEPLSFRLSSILKHNKFRQECHKTYLPPRILSI